MPRHSTLQRCFARLALVAALLMVVAPTISRTLKRDALPQLSAMSEHCDMVGMEAAAGLDADAGAMQSPLPDHPDPQGDQHNDQHDSQHADCAYCTLLAGTALLMRVLMLPLQQLSAPPASVWSSHDIRLSSVFPGLGSRGPPLAL